MKGLPHTCPGATIETWRRGNYHTQTGSVADRLSSYTEVTRRLHEAGIPMLAGTDGPTAVVRLGRVYAARAARLGQGDCGSLGSKKNVGATSASRDAASHSSIDPASARCAAGWSRPTPATSHS